MFQLVKMYFYYNDASKERRINQIHFSSAPLFPRLKIEISQIATMLHRIESIIMNKEGITRNEVQISD